MRSQSIIAEIGSTHDGNLQLAKKSIKKAANCGADIIKFQMHISEEETLKNAPNPNYFKKENRYDYFKRTAFTLDQWKKLILECKKNKVEFMCSPFSIKAVEELEKLKVKFYKVASGELTNLPLLEKIDATGKFVFISTGMSNFKEIENALKVFKKKTKICLMQCTSMYPCPDKYLGLNVIDEFKKRYKLKVGFSDHSDDPIPAICAANMGCDYIEKHFTLSKNLYGSDAKFAMEPENFKIYCLNINRAWKLKKLKVNKNNISIFKSMKKVFEKGIYAKENLSKNHQIKFKDLVFLKPKDGIRADEYKKIINLRLKNEINKLDKIKFTNLKK
jgi:N,N'-diacetyllegionaminate synthase